MKNTAPAKKLVPVALLVRVSTNRQDTQRQISELSAHAEAQGWQVVEVCEETISGRADEAHRAGLHRALELAQTGVVKKILVHELSRVARRNSTLHSFVEKLEEAGVSLYWHAHHIETLLPSGKRNPAAAIMLALLGELARSEVETLRERVKSGLEAARRKGVRLGRPVGTTTPPETLLIKHADIAKLLKAGHSVRHVARISGKGASTVMRVRKALPGGVA